MSNLKRARRTTAQWQQEAIMIIDSYAKRNLRPFQHTLAEMMGCATSTLYKHGVTEEFIKQRLRKTADTTLKDVRKDEDLESLGELKNHSKNTNYLIRKCRTAVLEGCPVEICCKQYGISTADYYSVYTNGEEGVYVNGMLSLPPTGFFPKR